MIRARRGKRNASVPGSRALAARWSLYGLAGGEGLSGTAVAGRGVAVGWPGLSVAVGWGGNPGVGDLVAVTVGVPGPGVVGRGDAVAVGGVPVTVGVGVGGVPVTVGVVCWYPLIIAG